MGFWEGLDDWPSSFGVGLNRCLRSTIGEMETERDMEGLGFGMKLF